MYSQPPGWAPPQEVTLYQDATGVIVTNARLVVGATVYPIRGLTAVQYVQLPASHTVPKVLVGVALLTFVMNASESLVGGSIMAAIFVVLAVVIAARTKPDLSIRILTAGGQIDAVVTPDAERAGRIVAALNQAVAGG